MKKSKMIKICQSSLNTIRESKISLTIIYINTSDKRII